MLTYIAAFIFYTLAMVGILLVGFVIYKKTFISARTETKGIIKVIDTYVIAPKKTLLLVKVRNEFFLIASDATSTTFLAKLTTDTEEEQNSESNLKEDAIRRILQKIETNPSYKTLSEEENKNYENEERNEAKIIQKQFMDLYRNSDVSELSAVKKASAKKEVIQKLLKELNESKTKTESRY